MTLIMSVGGMDNLSVRAKQIYNDSSASIKRAGAGTKNICTPSAQPAGGQ